MSGSVVVLEKKLSPNQNRTGTDSVKPMHSRKKRPQINRASMRGLKKGDARAKTLEREAACSNDLGKYQEAVKLHGKLQYRARIGACGDAVAAGRAAREKERADTARIKRERQEERSKRAQETAAAKHATAAFAIAPVISSTPSAIEVAFVPQTFRVPNSLTATVSLTEAEVHTECSHQEAEDSPDEDSGSTAGSIAGSNTHFGDMESDSHTSDSVESESASDGAAGKSIGTTAPDTSTIAALPTASSSIVPPTALTTAAAAASVESTSAPVNETTSENIAASYPELFDDQIFKSTLNIGEWSRDVGIEVLKGVGKSISRKLLSWNIDTLEKLANANDQIRLKLAVRNRLPPAVVDALVSKARKALTAIDQQIEQNSNSESPVSPNLTHANKTTHNRSNQGVVDQQTHARLELNDGPLAASELTHAKEHPLYKTQMCRHGKRCTYGNDCRFLHSSDAKVSSAPVTATIAPKPLAATLDTPNTTPPFGASNAAMVAPMIAVPCKTLVPSTIIPKPESIVPKPESIRRTQMPTSPTGYAIALVGPSLGGSAESSKRLDMHFGSSLSDSKSDIAPSAMAEAPMAVGAPSHDGSDIASAFQLALAESGAIAEALQRESSVRRCLTEIEAKLAETLVFLQQERSKNQNLESKNQSLEWSLAALQKKLDQASQREVARLSRRRETANDDLFGTSAPCMPSQQSVSSAAIVPGNGLSQSSAPKPHGGFQPFSPPPLISWLQDR